MGVTRKEKLLKAMLEDNASACGGGVTRFEKMLAGVAKKTCDNDVLEGGGGGGASGGGMSPTIFSGGHWPTDENGEVNGNYTILCNKTFEQCLEEHENGILYAICKDDLVLSEGEIASAIYCQNSEGNALYYYFYDPFDHRTSYLIYNKDGRVEIGSME